MNVDLSTLRKALQPLRKEEITQNNALHSSLPVCFGVLACVHVSVYVRFFRADVESDSIHQVKTSQ